MIAILTKLSPHLTPALGRLAAGPNYTSANILAVVVIGLAASGAAIALKKK